MGRSVLASARLLLGLVLLGTLGLVDASRVQPAAPGSLQPVLDSLRAADGFPGATAAYVGPDGGLRAFATGYVDREKSAPMRPDARMLSGSTGKSFAAAVVLSLAQEDRLDLDAPIARWLGDRPWFDRLPNGDRLTLRLLLRHESGLIDHIHSEPFRRTMQERMDTQGPEAALEPEEIVQFVLDTDPLFPAGEGYHYSDTNYILAGLIVEAVTGRSYYEGLRRRLLDPLELTLTTPATRRDPPGLVPGYNVDDAPFGLPSRVTTDGALVFNPVTEWTGGGLVTNSQDLARWGKALYEGKALPGAYRDALFDAVPKDSSQQARYGPDVRYGLGVTIRSTDLGTAYGHRGWAPGYLSTFEYYPEHDVAVALQINALGPYDMAEYAVRLGEAIARSTNH